MQPFSCDGVDEEHLMGVQGKSPRQLRNFSAIKKITGDGAAQMRHVDAYLMGSPRFQLQAHQ